MCQKTIHDEGHDLHISMWVFSKSWWWTGNIFSFRKPVHSSYIKYIKYKRRCKLKLLCTNFYIWSTSFVVFCIWVCLWKHVTDLTRIKMNTKPIAHHGSSFTLHQVIVHHPQNTKGARPFTVLCKVEMKSRLQPVLVGPSLAQNCWKLTEVIWHPKTLNLLTADLWNLSKKSNRWTDLHLRLGVRRILGIAEPSRIGLADLGLDLHGDRWWHPGDSPGKLRCFD